jgi:HAD superfamily hydrolase (TIGR01509 family)
MIKAVLFDLYETLITESHVAPTRASSLAHALGLERQAYRAEWKARRPRIVLGELSFADALTEVSQTLVGTVDTAAVQRICQQRSREKAAAFAHPDHQVMTLITDLGRRGIGLGVVSNGFREDVLPWSDCSLAPAFQCTAFSCEEGVAKPDPEIYLRAMRRLGVRPQTTVYIGDGGDNELTGAEQAGLRAFRAAWFVRSSAQGLPWPELATCGDVSQLVAAD